MSVKPTPILRDRKLLVVIALIQVATQIVMLRPTDPWWVVPVLSVIGFVAVVGVFMIIDWLAK